MIINVIGLGKLGFPMAKFLTLSKFQIKCFDINPNIRKIIRKNEKKYLRYEEKLHGDFYSSKKIHVCESVFESLNGTSISFVTVPTPSNKNGNFSNKYLINVLNQIAYYIKKFYKSPNPYLININSTISPGSIDKAFIPAMEKRGLKEGKNFQFIYNPYFVALGEVLSNLENPNFILIGHNNDYAKETISKIYKKIYKNPNFKFLSLKEAELTKLLLNCYITTKISFTNFINELCSNSKIDDCSKILNTLGSDKRIGNEYFSKGGPYSGPCFPRDNLALINFCKKTRTNSSIPVSTEIVNKQTIKNYKIKLCKFRKKFSKIAFLGIGYKKKTDCLDHSVALNLMQKAKNLGFKVFFYDKYTNFKNKKYIRCESIKEIISKSNLFFITYKDDEFKKLKLKKNISVWDIYNFIY